MFGTWVPYVELGDRLNGEAYSPDHLTAHGIIVSSGLEVQSLASLVIKPINNSIRNVSDEFDIKGSSIPMFRPADMSDGWVDPDTAPKLSSSFEEEHKKARVYPGDIVVAIAGTVGEVGRVPPTVIFGNINGSSARVAPRKGVEGYLLAYFRSCYGRSALLRWCVGAVQKHLNLEDMPGITVAMPRNVAAQTYIGNKVRQAEVLRERGRELRISVANSINALIGQWAVLANRNTQHSSVKLSADKLKERLDARFYRSDYILLEDALRGSGAVALNSLCRRVECGPFGGNAIAGDLYEATGVPFIRPINVTSNRFNNNDLVKVTEKTLHKSGLKVYNGEFLLFGRVGNPCVGLFQGTCSISPNIVIAEVKTSVADAGFLHAFCSSWVGIQQLARQMKEVAQPTTPTEAVRDLLVVLPSLHQQKRIGAANREIDECLGYAEQLTTAARLLVEALIERKVTETELVAAHNNPVAERALLKRLTPKGLDVEGADALFPDMDALYQLLEQVNEPEGGSGL